MIIGADDYKQGSLDVRAEFLGQPFDDVKVGRVLTDSLGRPEHESFWVVTAWAKRSGLSRIASAMKAFRERGGNATTIIGVDEGGATWEGLRLALELFDEAYVYHDPGTRTFHPKIYAVEGSSRATVAIGSSNLTKGGLFTNYEANVSMALDLSADEDVAFRDSVRAYYDRLLSTTPACQLLDEALLQRLQEDPTVLIGSEEKQNRARRRARSTSSTTASVFGSPVPGLAGAPSADAVPVLEADDADDDSPVVPPVEEEPAATEEAVDASTGTLGFFKTLRPNDVSLTSSPGQMIIPIRFLDFFGDLEVEFDHTATGGPRQSHKQFGLTFIDGASRREVDGARVILYEPAASHPRQNKDLRFTFHDREILESLNEGDVLVFRQSAAGITVERLPAGSMGSDRFGWV